MIYILTKSDEYGYVKVKIQSFLIWYQLHSPITIIGHGLVIQEKDGTILLEMKGTPHQIDVVLSVKSNSPECVRKNKE